jgi:hypothetical protein
MKFSAVMIAGRKHAACDGCIHRQIILLGVFADDNTLFLVSLWISRITGVKAPRAETRQTLANWSLPLLNLHALRWRNAYNSQRPHLRMGVLFWMVNLNADVPDRRFA